MPRSPNGTELVLGTLLDADRLEDAGNTLERGRRLAEELGTVWRHPLDHSQLGLRCLLAGGCHDAVAEVEGA